MAIAGQSQEVSLGNFRRVRTHHLHNYRLELLVGYLECVMLYSYNKQALHLKNEKWIA